MALRERRPDRRRLRRNAQGNDDKDDDDDDDEEEEAENPVLGHWEDGSPQTRFRGRCLVSRRLIGGPVLLSGYRGTRAVAFSVGTQVLDQLIAGTDYVVPRMSAAQRHGAGQLLDAKLAPRIGKCFHVELADLLGNPNRVPDMMTRAREARKIFKEQFRQRHSIERTLRLKMHCKEQFLMTTGNYLSWYDDEHKVAEYYGDTRDGKPHGFGYKVWFTGAEYAGEWVHGVQQTVKQPKATFTWADGTVYEGTFVRGKRHGKGTKTWPDGNIYSGEFALGLEHGLGKKTLPAGPDSKEIVTYEGRFRFGVRDGPGVVIYADGRRERGYFKDPALDAGGMDQEDLPRPPLRENELPDLLSLATTKLAHTVAEYPTMFSAKLLQGLLPQERKEIVAQTFVASAVGLSSGFRAVLPSIAWNLLPQLSLCSIRLTQQDLMMLIYFLETNDALKELSIQSCGLDASTVALFSDVIASSPSLKRIDFSWNKIGKQGAQAIVYAIEQRENVPALPVSTVDDAPGEKDEESETGVTCLRLMGCSLGATGCEFVAHMLKKNTSLTQVDIAFNDIGTIGAVCLSEVFRQNTHLTEVDLRSNRMGPSGGLALADAMLHAPSNLKVLKICDNDMGEVVAAKLAACLRGRTGHGLKSFSAGAIDGPKCVSGKLGLGSAARRQPKSSRQAQDQVPVPAAAGGPSVRPPSVALAKPVGVRLISDIQ